MLMLLFCMHIPCLHTLCLPPLDTCAYAHTHMHTHAHTRARVHTHTHTRAHTRAHTHTRARAHTQTKAISAESCYAQGPILGCLQNISSLMNLLVELISNSDVIFPSDLEVIAVALWNSTEYVQHV